jgi:hypothetical protein
MAMRRIPEKPTCSNMGRQIGSPTADLPEKCLSFQRHSDGTLVAPL